MQSGAHFFNNDRPMITKEEAITLAKQMAKENNCTEDKWLQCLKCVQADMLKFSKPLYSQFIEGTEFLPFSAQKAFNEGKFNKGI